MITEVTLHNFTQTIDGQKIVHKFEDIEIKNKSIILPPYHNKVEILFYNNGDDMHSLLVSKIFARMAILKQQGE